MPDASPRFLIQQHGEWSGMPDVLDLDYEADTEEEARKIIQEEIPSGCIYLVYDDDVLVEEATKG